MRWTPALRGWASGAIVALALATGSVLCAPAAASASGPVAPEPVTAPLLPMVTSILRAHAVLPDGAEVAMQCYVSLSAQGSYTESSGHTIAASFAHGASVVCSQAALKLTVSGEYLEGAGRVSTGFPDPATCYLCAATSSGGELTCSGACGGLYTAAASYQILFPFPLTSFTDSGGISCTDDVVRVVCTGALSFRLP